MKQKSISILGCGWLGMPLAKHLVNQDFTVKGSTTTVSKCEELLAHNIQPYVLMVDKDIDGNIDSFLNSDILFINVPYRKQRAFYNSYLALIEKIKVSQVKHVIFISSTSVYDNTNGEVVEDNDFVVNPAKKDLVAFEKLFQNHQEFLTTIVRFAGLIGGSRNPGNFFKPDRIVKNALAPINLIHLEDCIGIIENIILQEKWNNIYNGAAPSHPSKASYYKRATEQMKKPLATFEETLEDFKIISSQKVIDELDYTFQFPDLIDGLDVFKV